MCRIVIDCDPGIDDSLALMLALASPELNIAGITTVSGNVPVDMGTENAAKVLNWMERTDIPTDMDKIIRYSVQKSQHRSARKLYFF